MAMSFVRPMIKRCFSSGIQLNYFCKKNRGPDFVYFYDGHQKITTFQYGPKKSRLWAALPASNEAPGWSAGFK